MGYLTMSFVYSASTEIEESTVYYFLSFSIFISKRTIVAILKRLTVLYDKISDYL